jgi:hypothetical protein
MALCVPETTGGCFQIWESGQRCAKVGNANLTKSHADIPFGAVRSAAPVFIFFIFFMNG